MSDRMKIRNLWLFQFFADFAAIVAAYSLTYMIRFHSEWGIGFFTWFNRLIDVRDTGELPGMLRDFYLVSAPRIILILTAVLCLLYALMDLYSGRRFIRRRFVAWRILVANIAALAVFYAYFYLSRNVFHPRSYFVTVIFINTILCVWFRLLTVRFLDCLRSRFQLDQYSAVMIGDSYESDYLQSLIDTYHPHGLAVIERIKSEHDDNFDDLLSLVAAAVKKPGRDMLIMAETSLTIEQIMRLLELADDYELPVKVLSDKLDVLRNQARIHVDTIHGIPLVHFDAPCDRMRRNRFAQVLNRISAWILLLIAAVPMLIIVALIKLTSRGPVFFVQERIGGKP